MSDYLVIRAVQDIWCSPDQDRQLIIKPEKISRYGGIYTQVSIMWRRYDLPVKGVRFHVYQIGNVYPKALALTDPPSRGIWMKISDACMKEETIVDLYNDKGIQMPRSFSWYMVSEDNNLVIAVQDQPKIPFNLNEEELYIRFYGNAFYSSGRRQSIDDKIVVEGLVTRTRDEVLALQHAYDLAVAKTGHAYAFVNGSFVHGIDLLNAQSGDVVEYVYDSSIHTVADFQVEDLPVFGSSLDGVNKYLLHPTHSGLSNIDYHDDVDVFLYKTTTGERFKGVFYHRNLESSMRQVTHKDYSIPVAFILGYQASNPEWTDSADIVVRLHIRKSGFRRPLANEANRIKELYKLPESERLQAMIGLDAVVPEWQADTLESAGYTQVMREELKNITPTLVQRAYGYNAISQMLAPTPVFTKNFSGQILADVPTNLQTRSTMFEYDNQGLLKEWNHHIIGHTYVAQNSDTKLVEMITGLGVTELDEKYGSLTAGVNPAFDYRMYTCGLINGLPDNNWQDVTGSAAYTITDNQLVWHTDPAVQYTLVRSNRDFLCYNAEVIVQDGVLRFGLTSMQNRTGLPVNTLMQIPLGELDVIMNEHLLIEGVDYIVNFPEITVISKKWFVNPKTQAQKITIRFSGHCKSDLTREVTKDVGFVQHGVLSNNNRFDIRDDKVLHINVGGALYERSELSFAEVHSGVNVPGVVDGTPYLIRDIVVPMRGNTTAPTYALREISTLTDQHVSDYMTLKLPPPVFTEPLSIPQRYQVYSPFLSAVIEGLKEGLINDPRINGAYNDNVVLQICNFYERLLAFEPTSADHLVDDNFVVVHPYYLNEVVDLNLFKYRFLKRVVKLYLNDKIELSPFIRVAD